MCHPKRSVLRRPAHGRAVYRRAGETRHRNGDGENTDDHSAVGKRGRFDAEKTGRRGNDRRARREAENGHCAVHRAVRDTVTRWVLQIVIRSFPPPPNSAIVFDR